MAADVAAAAAAVEIVTVEEAVAATQMTMVGMAQQAAWGTEGAVWDVAGWSEAARAAVGTAVAAEKVESTAVAAKAQVVVARAVGLQ